MPFLWFFESILFHSLFFVCAIIMKKYIFVSNHSYNLHETKGVKSNMFLCNVMYVTTNKKAIFF